jgi:hypothetical protein
LTGPYLIVPDNDVVIGTQSAASYRFGVDVRPVKAVEILNMNIVAITKHQRVVAADEITAET